MNHVFAPTLAEATQPLTTFAWPVFVTVAALIFAIAVAVHSRRSSPMPRIAGRWVAPAVGWLVALVAALNIASALTPGLADRLHFLRSVVPNEVVAQAHAVSLSAAALLLAISVPVIRRRKNACTLAILLLVGLGMANMIKGLDVEEALLSWALAAVLWKQRRAFTVMTAPGVLRSVAWRTVVLGSSALLVACAAVTAAEVTQHRDLGLAGTLHEAWALLLGWRGSLTFTEHQHWLPSAVGVLGVVAAIATISPLFRPLRTPIGEPARRTMAKAHAILATHGAGTLGFFTLRNDNDYLFSDDGRAYLAYRVQHGVVVVSGDPVGDPASIPGLLDRLVELTEQRGLRLSVLGSGADLLPMWQMLGLRPVYLGDEAIVDTAGFSLTGRAIRKVRQSVTRLHAAGYESQILPVSELTDADLATFDAISRRWREGRPERGFTMALEGVGGPTQSACVVVVARDGDGVPRGYLHFAPVYGRSAMSLAAMRRDPDTPNGLMEFLICAAITGLREQGVQELSLNFAAFGRVMRAPANRRERLLRHVIGLGDRWFQISSLLRFNEKFSPRWEPRYLLCQGARRVPVSGLAAATAEGQIALPRLPFADAVAAFRAAR